MIISLVNSKGGSSRSTVSALLALFYLQQQKSVILVDADPFGSINFFAKQASDKGTSFPEFTCISLGTPDTAKVAGTKIQALEEKYDIVIVGTPSHNDQAIDVAADISDFVVVPLIPNPIDYAPSISSLERLAHVPYAVLLTQIWGGSLSPRFRQVLVDAGVYVFSTEIHHSEELGELEFLDNPNFLLRYRSLIDELDLVLSVVSHNQAAKDYEYALGAASNSSLARGLVDDESSHIQNFPDLDLVRNSF